MKSAISNYPIRYEDLYENDPQQLDNFFSLKGLLSGNHKAVPLGVRFISYGITFFFVLIGLAMIVSTIGRTISLGFGLGPRSFMLIAAGAIAVFCGLKITQGIVVFWMRKQSKAVEYGSFFSGHIVAKDVTFFQQVPNSVSSVVFDSLRPVYSVVEALHNGISIESESQQIIMGELFSTRRSTGSPSGVIVTEGYLIYLKCESVTKAEEIRKTEDISLWFQRERGFAIEEILPLRDVRMFLVPTGVVLLLPLKLQGPATAFVLLKLLQRNFYSKWYIDIEKSPEKIVDSSISVECLLYDGVAVGDSLFTVEALAGLSEHVAEALLGNSKDGICFVDDECAVTIENGVVKAIELNETFWKKREAVTLEMLKKQFGGPDNVFDNYLAMDDYIEMEEYYQFYSKGIEVTIPVNSKAVSSMVFKYFK